MKLECCWWSLSWPNTTSRQSQHTNGCFSFRPQIAPGWDWAPPRLLDCLVRVTKSCVIAHLAIYHFTASRMFSLRPIHSCFKDQPCKSYWSNPDLLLISPWTFFPGFHSFHPFLPVIFAGPSCASGASLAASSTSFSNSASTSRRSGGLKILTRLSHRWSSTYEGLVI